MGENFFTDEWYREKSEVLEKAEQWLGDMMCVVPPFFFGDLNKICDDPSLFNGSFPKGSATKDRIVMWVLNANILAPGFNRFANIGILTSNELNALYTDTPRSFAVSFHIQLNYNLGLKSNTEVLTSFTPEIIKGLLERTFLHDRVVRTVLDDAFNALPAFNEKIMSMVRNLLSSNDSKFIFDNTIRCLINLRAAFDNNGHALRLKSDAEKKSQDLYALARRASKSLTATAKRIENTKSFSKSRVLEKIRKETEQEAMAIDAKADEIYLLR